jgi:RNA polymerase sigma-70 factor (ECF subfamily)
MTSPAGRKGLELVQRAVSEHHAFVYRLAYRMLRNQADAEDLTQTVFVELLRSPDGLARAASPRAWLARVTFSKAASAKRGESRRRKREETWAKDRPEKADGDEMNPNDDVSEAIASLPDELRVPVVLHYQEGLKYREIAEVCGCAEGTVASRISTAKEKLREKLKHGGALAGFPSIEAALQAEGAVPVPAGLEARLLEGVAREFALVGGAQGAAGRAIGNRLGAFTGGTAFTVGAAFVLAGTLMTGGWLGIRGALERDEKGADAAVAAASASRRASGADPVAEASDEAAAEARRGGREGAGTGPAETAAGEGEEETADGAGAPASPVVLGWVRDRRGKPLEGVTVGIVPEGSDAPARTTTTDAEGYYEFDGVSPVHEAVATGFARSYDIALSAELQTATGALLLLDEAKEAEVQALETLKVRYEVAAQRQAEVASALAGLQPPPRSRVVSGGAAACPQSKAGACSSCHDAGMSGDAQASMEHARYTRVLAESQEWLVRTQKLALAGERLSFIQAMSAGHTVVAQLDGYRVEVSRPFEVKDGEPVEVELTLEPTAAITGSVLSADGSPLAEADVAVVGHAGDRLLPGAAARTKTDADGAFAFGSLPAGTYAIRASAAGFEPVEAVAFTGGHAPFVLPFTGSARVTVVRSETGEPLSGYRVDLRKGRRVIAQAVTGEDGVAQIPDVPPGDYAANTYHEGSTSRQSRAQGQVTVLPQREAALRLEVAKKMPVAGRVGLLDPGASPAGFSVKATRLDGSGEVDASPKVVEVAADGSFQWSSGLAPGDYIIDLHRGEKASGEAIGSMDLEVTAGRAIEDLVIAEGATRPGGRAGRRDAARTAAAEPRPPFEPLPVDDRTVTVQEPMKLRTFIALLGAAGAAAVAPNAEVEASGALDHARVETTGTSGFQSLLRGALEAEGLRWAHSGGRIAIETAASR